MIKLERDAEIRPQGYHTKAEVNLYLTGNKQLVRFLTRRCLFILGTHILCGILFPRGMDIEDGRAGQRVSISSWNNT